MVAAACLLNFSIVHRTPTRRANSFYPVPPFTALTAWSMFDERLTLVALLGATICSDRLFQAVWSDGTSATPLFSHTVRSP